MRKSLKLLRVDSSGRYQGSSTRALTDSLVESLTAANTNLEIVARDLAKGMPHVDEQWIQANFTDDGERNSEQREVLQYSDDLVAEVTRADVIVIGMPIYNFGIPAALKAWIDMIARARMTFRYTENGPVGLLTEKKVYLVIASGGVAVDSEVDFATPYMRQALRFLGMTDVTVVSADQQLSRGEESLALASKQIEHLARSAETRAA